jgi:hypothetical protein
VNQCADGQSIEEGSGGVTRQVDASVRVPRERSLVKRDTAGGEEH